MKKSKKPSPRPFRRNSSYADSVHWGRQANLQADIMNSYLAKQLILAGYRVTIYGPRFVAVWLGDRMVCAVEPVGTGTRTSWAVLGGRGGEIERYGAWEEVEDAVNRLVNEESC